jgi:hypothetical protein
VKTRTASSPAETEAVAKFEGRFPTPRRVAAETTLEASGQAGRGAWPLSREDRVSLAVRYGTRTETSFVTRSVGVRAVIWK